MGNAAITGTNLADAGTVAASSQERLMPASLLLNPHVERRWRSQVNAAFVVADLGAPVAIDVVLVRGLTVGANATCRVRISSADSSGSAGDLYDSASDDGVDVDADYGTAVTLLATPVTGRYVRIDLYDPDASYVEAGRLFVGRLTTFTYNFGYGWQLQRIDRSVSVESRGGQDLVWRDNNRRLLTVDFRWITDSERNGVVEQIDRVNGQNRDVLLVLDVDSTMVARDCILGLVNGVSPVVQPDAVFADGPLYSKQYVVKERL